MQPEWIAAAVGTLIVVVIVCVAIYKRWPKQSDLSRFVLSVGERVLVDFFIPDGLGGEIHIDHLLLTSRGLLVLDTRDVAGTVFAGERLELWSATSPGGRVTFANPIPLLEARIAAVRMLSPGVPVTGKVVFTSPVVFPKGHPESVESLTSLAEEYADQEGGENLYTMQWDMIEAAAKYA